MRPHNMITYVRNLELDLGCCFLQWQGVGTARIFGDRHLIFNIDINDINTQAVIPFQRQLYLVGDTVVSLGVQGPLRHKPFEG